MTRNRAAGTLPTPATATHCAQRASAGLILDPDTGGRPTGPQDLALIEDGTADLLSFGRLFIAGPGLPRRLVRGGPFAEVAWASYYGGGAEGYTDYPAPAG